MYKGMNVMALKNLRAASVSEGALFFLTLLLWIDRILLSYIRAFAMSFPIIGFMTDYIITAIYGLLIVFSVPKIFKCLRTGDIIFCFVTVVVCLFNCIIFPENAEVVEELMPSFLFFVFPLYFIGISLDFEKVYPWLYRLSLVTIAAFTLYKISFSAPMTDIQSQYQGDMWSAYNILPHVCVVAVAMLKRTNFINLALTIVGVIMIASLGSRGPLICAVLSMVTYLFFFKKYKNSFLAYCIITIVAVAVIAGLETIMQSLYDISKEAGLSIRIFEKFFEESFTDASSRDLISASLYKRIAENSICGYGMFSDRVAVGTYAHNIAIELWYSFGVVLGTAILGGIIAILVRAAKVSKKVEKYALLFIPLLFAGFIKLFLSSSFLEEIYLFWLLGICVRFLRSSKNSGENKVC